MVVFPVKCLSNNFGSCPLFPTPVHSLHPFPSLVSAVLRPMLPSLSSSDLNSLFFFPFVLLFDPLAFFWPIAASGITAQVHSDPFSNFPLFPGSLHLFCWWRRETFSRPPLLTFNSFQSYLRTLCIPCGPRSVRTCCRCSVRSSKNLRNSRSSSNSARFKSSAEWKIWSTKEARFSGRSSNTQRGPSISYKKWMILFILYLLPLPSTIIHSFLFTLFQRLSLHHHALYCPASPSTCIVPGNLDSQPSLMFRCLNSKKLSFSLWDQGKLFSQLLLQWSHRGQFRWERLVSRVEFANPLSPFVLSQAGAKESGLVLQVISEHEHILISLPWIRIG